MNAGKRGRHSTFQFGDVSGCGGVTEGDIHEPMRFSKGSPDSSCDAFFLTMSPVRATESRVPTV